jgi:hypothetical protein
VWPECINADRVPRFTVAGERLQVTTHSEEVWAMLSSVKELVLGVGFDPKQVQTEGSQTHPEVQTTSPATTSERAGISKMIASISLRGGGTQ